MCGREREETGEGGVEDVGGREVDLEREKGVGIREE